MNHELRGPRKLGYALAVLAALSALAGILLLTDYRDGDLFRCGFFLVVALLAGLTSAHYITDTLYITDSEFHKKSALIDRSVKFEQIKRIAASRRGELRVYGNGRPVVFSRMEFRGLSDLVDELAPIIDPFLNRD